MCKTVCFLHRCPPHSATRLPLFNDRPLSIRHFARLRLNASDDIFSDDFLVDESQTNIESEEPIDEPPTELILNLKRRGHGWGEEIVPYVTVEWRAIHKQKRPRFRSHGPGPWEEGSIECELVRAGVPREAVEKVAAAAAAWRVTPGGRPLIDRRRSARVQRNAAGVIGHLINVCGIPLGSNGIGQILMKAPQILLAKVRATDRWNIRVVELAAFMQLHGHSNVPADWNVSPTLARWVQRQRECHKQGELNEERVQILNALGFNFGDGRIRFGHRWRNRLDDYVDWMIKTKERGNSLDWTGMTWTRLGGWHAAELAAWAMKQRELRRKGWLPKDCIDRMDYFHFDWEIPTGDGTLDRWMQNFGKLAVEIEKSAVSNKRNHSYALENITLSADDKKGLGGNEGQSKSAFIGASEKQVPYDWYHRPVEAISIKTGIPKLEPMGELQLTQDVELWLEEQRYLWKRSKLPIEKVTLLYSLGMDLDPYRKTEWTQLAHLSTSFLNNFDIEDRLEPDIEGDVRETEGSWLLMPEDIVSVTRGGDVVERVDFKTFSAMRNEVNVVAMDPLTSSPELLTAINTIGLSEENDDCEERRWDVEEWIRTQRVIFKEGRLSQNRMQYMAILGLTWLLSDEIVEMSDDKWQAYFQRMSYPESSKDLTRLKEFTFYQRALHRIGFLKKEREDALKSIGFSFDAPEKTSNEVNWDNRISDLLELTASEDQQVFNNTVTA